MTGDTDPSMTPDEELSGRQTGAGRHDSRSLGTRGWAGPGRSGHRPDPAAPYDRSPMDTGLSDSLAALVAAAVEASDNPSAAKLAREMLESAVGLIGDRPDTLDLKIAAAALAEMREAFSVFAPYRDVPKVTVFGSARTATNDPLYAQATEIAKLLAARGWMVVTGAGPGIMQAAMEGAGRERSIGVSIRLPFEQGANPVIAGDEKYVSMKYFFTRKLILVKESRAFVCLPGGFGTLDETFELLTLTQTGKGLPVPDHLPRHGRRSVLGVGGRARPQPTGHPQPRVGGGHPPLLRHRFVRRCLPGDRTLLRQLRLDPLRRQPGDHPPAEGADRRAARPPQRAVRPPHRLRPSRTHRARSPSSFARPIASSCRASASSSPSTSTATCER